MPAPAATTSYAAFAVHALRAIAQSQTRCAAALRTGARDVAEVALRHEAERLEALAEAAACWRAPAGLADAHAHLERALQCQMEVADALRALHGKDLTAEARVVRLIGEVEWHVDQALAHQHDVAKRVVA